MNWRDGLTWARRFLVVIALMFWLGGFTFYAAVVVPIGQDVVGKHRQSFITRQVAVWINVAAGAALAVLALDMIGAGGRGQRCRWLTWLGMAAGLGVLVWLYPHIDRHMDADTGTIGSPTLLRPWHRAYLWVSTIQWGFGLVYVGLTLRAWRAADRKSPLAA